MKKILFTFVFLSSIGIILFSGCSNTTTDENNINSEELVADKEDGAERHLYNFSNGHGTEGGCHSPSSSNHGKH